MPRTPNLSGAGSEFQRLRHAYDDAFRHLTVAVQEHTGLVEAEREYHQRRDSLAQVLIGDEHRRCAVERLAYSLWEQAGCPPGTAESDWYRAETLVLGHSQGP